MSSLSEVKPIKILLGVTGGIAAYKAAYLLRDLVKSGFEVKVLMTKSAKDFVGPLTFSTLSKNPVLSDLFNASTGEWVNHVELGMWADLFVIAPATANTIGKAANGMADNLLLTTYLSAKCPVLWAPAMDLDMYRHPSTKENLEKLKSFGDQIIEPEEGELASGLIGKGRLAEPEEILSRVNQSLQDSKGLKKKSKGAKVLVTAGPTFEAIDPVRFIGNRSSGKMGYAIAEALASSGYDVELVSGPSNQKTNHPKISVSLVESAKEMADAALKLFPDCKAAVLSAAVADYRPKEVYSQKKKKINGKPMNLEMVETIDIAHSLKEIKQKGQFVVGFALETNNELENAKGKMKRKGFDMIVLNSLNDKGAGFQTDTNKVTLIQASGKQEELPLMSKKEVATHIVEKIDMAL